MNGLRKCGGEMILSNKRLALNRRPTKRAADGRDSARFINIFLAGNFFCSQTVIYSRRRPPLTQAVRQPAF